MVSFFEKLKKGMGVEEDIENEQEEKTDKEEIKEETEKKKTETPKELKEEKKSKKNKKSKKEEKPAENEPEVKIRKLEIQTETLKENTDKEPLKKQTEEKPAQIEETQPESGEIAPETEEKKHPSFCEEEEGQLAIDAYQTESDLIIQSVIAGVKPENLKVSIERDIISIKGDRKNPLKEKGDYFVQECFWGSFSREIIAPVEIDPGRAEAEMKNGVLTIIIPKISKEKKKTIIVKG